MSTAQEDPLDAARYAERISTRIFFSELQSFLSFMSKIRLEAVTGFLSIVVEHLHGLKRVLCQIFSRQ